MKIGVFGGTFNPPHRGHNLLLKEISKQEHFDKIIIIPSNMPPHKNVERNDPAQRMEMARLAFPEYEVSDIEPARRQKLYMRYAGGIEKAVSGGHALPHLRQRHVQNPAKMAQSGAHIPARPGRHRRARQARPVAAAAGKVFGTGCATARYAES